MRGFQRFGGSILKVVIVALLVAPTGLFSPAARAQTGSSAATQDMALWGEAYKPDAMLFLMHPTGEPRDIGMAVKLVTTGNPNLKALLPHHHRVTPPPGAPTAADVRATLDSMEIRIPTTDPVRKHTFAK